MSETYSQSSAVAEFYDNTEAMEVFAGENLHVGYWDTLPGDPTDQGADFVEAQNRLTDLVGARSGAVQNARLLDVGCGTGGPARRLARTTGVAVTGVTISSNQVEVAAARSREQGLDTRTDFRLADAASLPFADQQFDGAFAIESIVHMQDKPAGLRRDLPGAAPRGGPLHRRHRPDRDRRDRRRGQPRSPSTGPSPS